MDLLLEKTAQWVSWCVVSLVLFCHDLCVLCAFGLFWLWITHLKTTMALAGSHPTRWGLQCAALKTCTGSMSVPPQ